MSNPFMRSTLAAQAKSQAAQLRLPRRDVNWPEFLVAGVEDAELVGRTSKGTQGYVVVGAEMLRVVGPVPKRGKVGR